ncbi:MAG: hypothetical protein QGI86_15030 [Candidatus Poribacteria bacterium]|jgi:hypothetical protein|nr:hypothetical protein [Candidatus Poribacteria bacterium]MDP6749592.1 hypothetical protein [Candidatus Poribacteria bacterium]MDP6959901.1 hypothetical protein [Dehalococcoidia bacterium]
MRHIDCQKTFKIVSQTIFDDKGLAGIRESYKQEGYCVVDDVYSAAELDEMKFFFEDFKNQEHNQYK